MRAWDLPTRLFHWLLAALIAAAWASWQYSEALGDPTLSYHRWIGHAVLVLIVFRMLWGFVGSSTSRFCAWLYWPWTAAAYLVSLLSGRSRPYLGHTPVGSYMILALLAVTTAQAVARPAHRRAQRPHRRTALPADLGRPPAADHQLASLDVLLGDPAAGRHPHPGQPAATASSRKTRLITGMITGRKPAADYADAPRGIHHRPPHAARRRLPRRRHRRRVRHHPGLGGKYL